MDAKLLAKIKQSVVVAKEARRFRYSGDVKMAARKLMESGATPTEVAQATGIGQGTLYQ